METTHTTTTSPSKAERVVITGFGLFTPVGTAWLDTARAIHEGRSCYRAHETVVIADDPDGSLRRGATISRIATDRIPRTMKGDERISALLVPPITECLSGIPASLHGSLYWKIVTPPDGSADFILGAMKKKMSMAGLTEDAFCATQKRRSEFFGRIASAAEALLNTQTQWIMVSCADSLCDAVQLRQLMLEHRLKDATNPYGIMAGEAGGAIVLERESTARSRGVAILAAIAAWGEAMEPNPWPSGKPSKALGLTTAFHKAFEKLDDQGASVAHVVSDENGERQRALEWALTAGRIFPNPEKERNLWRPAVTTGDAGGAQGAILLADGLARLVMNTPRGERIALAVSDDGGDRQVICLERVEQPEHETLFSMIRSQIGNSK